MRPTWGEGVRSKRRHIVWVWGRKLCVRVCGWRFLHDLVACARGALKAAASLCTARLSHRQVKVKLCQPSLECSLLPCVTKLVDA